MQNEHKREVIMAKATTGKKKMKMKKQEQEKK